MKNTITIIGANARVDYKKTKTKIKGAFSAAGDICFEQVAYESRRRNRFYISKLIQQKFRILFICHKNTKFFNI